MMTPDTPEPACATCSTMPDDRVLYEDGRCTACRTKAGLVTGERWQLYRYLERPSYQVEREAVALGLVTHDDLRDAPMTRGNTSRHIAATTLIVTRAREQGKLGDIFTPLPALPPTEAPAEAGQSTRIIPARSDHPPTEAPAPAAPSPSQPEEPRGTGQFPPDAACVCGADDPEPCLGSDHETRWEDGTFKGSKCECHGGHKFQPIGQPEEVVPGAAALAQRFHETYERLAPEFSYETRKASAVPWADVPENNRRLMIAVTSEVIAAARVTPRAVLDVAFGSDADASASSVPPPGGTAGEALEAAREALIAASAPWDWQDTTWLAALETLILAAARVPQETAGGLFQRGEFTLSSGQASSWKIECDALTHADWRGLAYIAMERWDLQFVAVVGVPTGGIPFAAAMHEFEESYGPTLVVDDVLTTGESLRAEMAKYPDSIGLVAFARGPLPPNVKAVWQSGGAGGEALEAEQLAEQFHEAYERLAPEFSYETRTASAVPWSDVPENNKRLMIAVAGEVLIAATQGGA